MSGLSMDQCHHVWLWQPLLPPGFNCHCSEKDVVHRMSRMVLGISGSPRRGDTEHIVEEALRIASERGYHTERVLCSEAKIGYCTGCGNCGPGQGCPIDDDMGSIFGLLKEASGIIVASPVYFGSVTGQLKVLFDRTLPLRRQGSLLRDKAGCALCVGGFRNGGQEQAIAAIWAWMHIQGMIVVGDGSHFGGTLVRPASQDSTGMETVLASASKLCDLLDRTGRIGGCWYGD
ncbi:MAG: Iron-sulfur flavoprotein [Methanosaeta sp. PtaB.Bin039]|nr:MAG: Iron-sulfur flavoprotein [Methanosaeta sp. PtaB.Bin039]